MPIVTKMPPVPAGKLRVQAVHSGYFNNTHLDESDVFDIPIEPLNPKNGLPICFSDWRNEKVAPGRSGWMKPFGASEEKKFADLEAAFAKSAQKPVNSKA